MAFWWDANLKSFLNLHGCLYIVWNLVWTNQSLKLVLLVVACHEVFLGAYWPGVSIIWLERVSSTWHKILLQYFHGLKDYWLFNEHFFLSTESKIRHKTIRLRCMRKLMSETSFSRRWTRLSSGWRRHRSNWKKLILVLTHLMSLTVLTNKRWVSWISRSVPNFVLLCWEYATNYWYGL